MIWHSEPMEKVVEILDTDTKRGLSNGVAQQRLHTCGSNTFSREKANTFFAKFVAQLNHFPTIALLTVAVLSLIVTIITNDDKILSPILIFTIVIINAAIGAYEEIKSEDMTEVLKDITAPSATVIREGHKKVIDASQLVPGDLIVLKEGDYISADARIISANTLCCDESPLTGSHVPVDKVADMICEDIAPLDARNNMVYSGCSVIHGTGLALVVETGLESEIGKGMLLLEQGGKARVPLKDSVAAFAKAFSIVTIAICFLVFIIGMLFNFRASTNISRTLIDTFLNSMALAVAIIPEGLTTAAAVAVTLGLQRLVTKNVIAKNISSLEIMGRVNVICSDKTGTLTENIMTVTKIYNGKETVELHDNVGDDIKMILELATICNDSTESSGDPTGMGIAEACLKVCRMSKQDIENLYPRLGDIPFDSQRKLMSTINMINGKPFVIVKGAPESITPLCVGNTGERVTKASEALADEALRVIAVAAKPIDEISANPNPEELECNLNFIGLIGLADSPRAEAVKTVADCKKSGIKTVMITGDHPATARVFARRLGILTDDTQLITSAELENMTDEELTANIERYSVYARISNPDRLRIVRAWQQKGHCVAVTGDSVSDVPALMAADVGCAMGKSGTDVAKGVSDIILTDDGFSSIADAIKEGRSIFANIKKILFYLLSSNIGELLFVLFGVLIFKNVPLAAVQLLCINLMTDLMPVVALGLEPPEQAVMSAPTQKRQTFADKRFVISTACQGIIFGAIALIAYSVGLSVSAAVASATAFAVLIFSQILFSLSVRTDTTPLILSLTHNRFLPVSAAAVIVLTLIIMLSPISVLFELEAVASAGKWMIIVLLSLIPFAVNECVKLVRYIKTK